MAPVAVLVADSIAYAVPGAIINIFAGIPAPTKYELDIDTYIAKKCYMFGTSGSVIDDMKIVLRKVESGTLDTNSSVDAISGMAGATAGIKAIEERTLAGKIIVYPMLHDIGLIPLVELGKHFPTVAAKLNDGQWTKGRRKRNFYALRHIRWGQDSLTSGNETQMKSVKTAAAILRPGDENHQAS